LVVDYGARVKIVYLE